MKIGPSPDEKKRKSSVAFDGEDEAGGGGKTKAGGRVKKDVGGGGKKEAGEGGKEEAGEGGVEETGGRVKSVKKEAGGRVKKEAGGRVKTVAGGHGKQGGVSMMNDTVADIIVVDMSHNIRVKVAEALSDQLPSLASQVMLLNESDFDITIDDDIDLASEQKVQAIVISLAEAHKMTTDAVMWMDESINLTGWITKITAAMERCYEMTQIRMDCLSKNDE